MECDIEVQFTCEEKAKRNSLIKALKTNPEDEFWEKITAIAPLDRDGFPEFKHYGVPSSNVVEEKGNLVQYSVLAGSFAERYAKEMHKFFSELGVDDLRIVIGEDV